MKTDYIADNSQAENEAVDISTISASYYEVFLSLRCPHGCSFCVHRFHEDCLHAYQELSGQEWITFLSSLPEKNIPLIIQGGEPGLHRDFVKIIQHLAPNYPLTIMTNLAFDIEPFIEGVDPEALNNNPFHAPIQVSCNPLQDDFAETITKAEKLKAAGFRINLFGFNNNSVAPVLKQLCAEKDLPLYMTTFVDWYQIRFYGGIKQQDRDVRIPSGLLFAPDGAIHQCHHYLYEHLQPIGHILTHSIIPSHKQWECDMGTECRYGDDKLHTALFHSDY